MGFVVNDLTSFGNRSNPGANILNQGCLKGLRACTLFDPLQLDANGNPPDVRAFNKGDLLINAENGKGWTTDIRTPGVTRGAVLADLIKRRAVVEWVLSNKTQRYGVTDYDAINDWWVWANGDEPDDGGKFAEAFDLWLSFANRRTRIAIDCHRFTQVPHMSWFRSTRWRTLRARAAGFEVDLVWQMKWHAASDDESRADQPITYADAKPMIVDMLSLEPRGIWVMGGDTTIKTDQGDQWARLPVESYPDLFKITKHLTTGRAAA